MSEIQTAALQKKRKLRAICARSSLDSMPAAEFVKPCQCPLRCLLAGHHTQTHGVRLPLLCCYDSSDTPTRFKIAGGKNTTPLATSVCGCSRPTTTSRTPPRCVFLLSFFCNKRSDPSCVVFGWGNLGHNIPSWQDRVVFFCPTSKNNINSDGRTSNVVLVHTKPATKTTRPGVVFSGGAV